MPGRAAPPPPDLVSTSMPMVRGRGGLPEILLQTANACVVHGDDAGEFYCEHAFFSAQRAAAAARSVVVDNAQGEKLVGFLHVPRDDATASDGPTLDQEHRHRGTRQVVAAALRGFIDDVVAVGVSEVRVLITGYLEWGDVKNNPTGDFVAHGENLHASMVLAFGDLVTAGPLVRSDERTLCLAYTMRRGVKGRSHKVRLQATQLSVDDDAINGSAHSLQGAMASFRPHAVLSLGVHRGALWIAEHHADDVRLGERDGLPAHDDNAPPRTVMANNFALPRALHRGGLAFTS